MKTAISLEDELLEEADRTAKQMGLSRSRLFSLALQDYLRHRREREIVEQLNRVYGQEPAPPDDGMSAKMKAKFRATVRDRW
jgi:hypothetical protein